MMTRSRALVGASLTLLLYGAVAWMTPARAACEDPPAPNVDWTGCDKSGADLAGADLSYATLRAVNFEGANLSDVNFDGALMMRANLRNADITGVSIEGTHLSAAIMPDGEKCGWYSVGTCTHN